MRLSGVLDHSILHLAINGYPVTLVAATVCLAWYIVVAIVCTIGFVQIFRYYSSPPPALVSSGHAALPHVTVIRPVKGLEPFLYECLAATFRQHYPHEKIHVRFCVSSRSDPAFPVLQRLLRDFPDSDAQVFVEEEDEVLVRGQLKLGPNPKIRNMSRAYRQAFRGKDDIIWIIDCNVWVGSRTLERMVATLEGNKFVHLLPLSVDTISTTVDNETRGRSGGNGGAGRASIRTTSLADQAAVSTKRGFTWQDVSGGRLDETFMASAHAKFYTAINTVLFAPCSVGKSTMFRTRHLDSLTEDRGIDFFSENICEDHLIGDLLWKGSVEEERNGIKLGKHRLCFGDLAIQPVGLMDISEYWRRRVRWLRVRKFTVTLATLVEPGTESFLCSLYGAYAVTALPFFHETLHVPPTWTSFAMFWLLSVSIWCAFDRIVYLKLHSAASVYLDENTPVFAQPQSGERKRVFLEWLAAWLGREVLALPIWIWAFWGGTTVEWRGKRFWVGMDMKVHEVMTHVSTSNGHIDRVSVKSRRD